MWKIETQFPTRECLYIVYGKEPRKAYFHTWTMEPISEMDGQGIQQWISYPSAIIEFEDGTVEVVNATSIKFEYWSE